MGLINDKLKAYRVALRQEMKNSQWYQIPVWAPMIGHIGGTENGYAPKSVPFGAAASKTLRPTGKPIEVLTDWNHMGGWEMDIPILLPLRQKPVYGDVEAQGKEEERDWIYLRAIINQVRKPAKTRDGLMGEQALTAKMVAQIWGNMKQEFIEYNRKWQAYAPYDALYRGFSDNILASKADGGFGHVISQRSHPNFYVAGYGKVAWSNTPATYETNVAAALDGLTTANHFDSQVIKNAKLLGGRHRINAVKVGPYDVNGIMIINDAQAAQLIDDDLFQKTHVALITKEGQNSALFTGNIEAYLFLGVLILVDMNNPGVWTAGDEAIGYKASRGLINYGNENPLDNPIMATDRKLALYVGASAVLCGHTVSLNFKNRSDDYDNVRGESSYTVVGYNRADRFDHDGFIGTAGNFLDNCSSMVIATNSPNTPSWTVPVVS